jgi:hypothetical protein
MPQFVKIHPGLSRAADSGYNVAPAHVLAFFRPCFRFAFFVIVKNDAPLPADTTNPKECCFP